MERTKEENRNMRERILRYIRKEYVINFANMVDTFMANHLDDEMDYVEENAEFIDILSQGYPRL